MTFDFDRTYYRVLGTRPGYIYNQDEPTIVATAQGLVTDARPIFEFDDLDDVGRWLFLGDRVRRLRVPREAMVVRNRPMSQGGCHTWSADRIELLEIVDIAGLMQEYRAAEVEPWVLHLDAYEFPAGFRFPTGVDFLLLEGCLACAPLELPARLERLSVSGSALRIDALPPTLAAFEARDSLFEGLAGPPSAAARVHVGRCVFVPTPRAR